MNSTAIIWSILVLLVTNIITSQIAWRRGVKNGEKWEKYRQETRVTSQEKIPYGDRFRKDLNLDPADWVPTSRHRRRKINGQWTED